MRSHVVVQSAVLIEAFLADVALVGLGAVVDPHVPHQDALADELPGAPGALELPATNLNQQEPSSER